MVKQSTKSSTSYSNNNYSQNSYSSSRSKSKKPKKSIWVKLANLVTKIFEIVAYILGILYIIARETIKLVVTAAVTIAKLFTNPFAHCFMWLLAFTVICLITLIQWSGVGTWFFGIFGVSQIFGFSTSLLGIVFGIGINYFQMSSKLWQIKRGFARYYAQNNVDVEVEEEDVKTPQDKLSNWASSNHKELKKGRALSHAVEIGLMVAYVFFGAGFGFAGLRSLLLGVIALTLPEFTLGKFASAVDLLAPMGASEARTYESDEEFKEEYFKF